MPALIDSHAHLGDAAYDDDRADVLQHAAAAGVEAVVVIGYDADSSVRAIEVARQGGPVSLFATAGVAPHHVLEVGAGDLDRIRAALDDDIVVAVGEIGLDYHYDMPPDAQRELFSTQLEWARETGLPAVIHSREAEDDVVDLLREHGAGAANDGSVAETPGSTVNASPGRISGTDRRHPLLHRERRHGGGGSRTRLLYFLFRHYQRSGTPPTSAWRLPACRSSAC